MIARILFPPKVLLFSLPHKNTGHIATSKSSAIPPLEKFVASTIFWILFSCRCTVQNICNSKVWVNDKTFFIGLWTLQNASISIESRQRGCALHWVFVWLQHYMMESGSPASNNFRRTSRAARANGASSGIATSKAPLRMPDLNFQRHYECFKMSEKVFWLCQCRG